MSQPRRISPLIRTFPNGRYILDINDPDFPEQYQHLLVRLDYLTKLDTKASGQRNFGYSGF
ncbi:TPA: inovirus-type Gp2 protein [Escherichia coli]|nr:inovirus-type Gp2 protein [Escherichia coli]